MPCRGGRAQRPLSGRALGALMPAVPAVGLDATVFGDALAIAPHATAPDLQRFLPFWALGLAATPLPGGLALPGGVRPAPVRGWALCCG